MRKLVIDRVFAEHDESWTDIGRIRRLLEGGRIIDQGVLDVPPWPDTVMPATGAKRPRHPQPTRSRSNYRRRLAVEHHGLYLGQRPDLRERWMKCAWLDHAAALAGQSRSGRTTATWLRRCRADRRRPAFPSPDCRLPAPATIE